MQANRTQRVTAVDIANGRIRIPIGEKAPFPVEKARLDVDLRGLFLRDVAWDPRSGPDRERSGVLQIGIRLKELVAPDEVLDVIGITANRVSLR
jgi:hypothetical protein